MPLVIAELPAGGGTLALCPMPGRDGQYQADLSQVVRWSPDLVLTMTPMAELRAKGAWELPDDLALHQIKWAQFPVVDFGTPGPQDEAIWTPISAEARKILSQGGRVLAHCLGGCGRSGMAILRLMVELGEDPQTALNRLRDVRPCAVETPDQFAWASKPQTNP